MTRDLDIISGDFLEHDIPKDRRYLLKYFTTPLQAAFLKYYMATGDVAGFCDATGHHCSKRIPARLRDKYETLVSTHDLAKKSLTEEGMNTLFAIESGKFVLTKKKEP